MNKRTVSIIHELCDSKENSILGLAEKFQVSQRTIRNDLNLISDLLKENSMSPIELQKGGIIQIPDDFQKLTGVISGDDFYEYKLSKEERKKIASAMLVNASGFLTLSAIAEALAVSRATIIGDLDEIKAFIRKNSLEVLSHPNKGLRVEGKESDKRIFLMSLADMNLQSRQDMVQKQICEADETRELVGKILHEQEHIHKCYLTDDSFSKIQIYLRIMVRRNCQGEYIEVRRRRGNSKYLMAEDIMKYVSQYCHTTATESEIQFLSELLVLARYMKQRNSDQNAVKIQVLTRKFIEKVSEETGIDLNEDYELFENLAGHLEAVCIQSAIPGKNPVIEELLKENKKIEQAVLKAFPLLCQHAGREIPETEAGYIAVHFCAAIERKKNKEVSFHVIVACHAGIGTSHLLLERLKKHFNFQIVDIVSSHEAMSLEPEAADFIVSTVPLKGCKLKYIIVSPLFTDEDYIRVGNLVDSLRDSRNLPVREEKRQISAKGLLGRLSTVIYEKVPEQAEGLMHEIAQIIGEYFQEPVQEESVEWIPDLAQLLPVSHIQLDVSCSDWKDAIRKSAEFLLENKYIEERYINAMIHNVEENGPYIVISQGFAVPHEGCDQGSLRTGMNLIRLKSPVEFGDEDTDPIEFVCCLSAKDHKTHLKAFFHLVNLLRQETFKDELRSAKTSEEVTEIIYRYENRLEEDDETQKAIQR